MKQKSIILFCCLLSMSIAGVAQQQATFSQYMFNGLAINPAYAGSQGAMTATVVSRFQNVGLPGAPNTQSLSIHSPLANDRVAVGLLVVHDKLAVIGQTGVNAIYAYRLPMQNGGSFSMGIQAGFSSYRADYSSLDVYQPDLIFAQDVRQTRPNVGAGIYYSTKMWYAGLSMPHMVNNVFQRGNNYQTVYQSTPVIVSGGYVFELNRMMKIKPNFLFKYIDKRAVELDLNANLLFDDVLWVGVSYKFSNALTGLVQVQATDQLRFGYSYSVTMGPIRHAELGSHEVVVSYRFKYFSKGIITPRYF